jgi:uncharacterized protein (DUF302 family)
MKTKVISVDRISVTSFKPFDEVVKTLEAGVGHPDMSAFIKEVTAAQTEAELEQIVSRATGPSELMVFMRLDIGGVLRKEQGTSARKSYRFIIGNPVTMKSMVKHVADAASYAPVTILVDERADGVHLSYDRMASFLAPYGGEEALKVARELDAKVEKLITRAAA